MICILSNTVVLALKWYGIDKSIENVCENLNYVFMGIFLIEAILKLTAFKSNYFKDGWNIFDFSVVILSGVALIIANIPGIGIDMSAQATMLRILRTLRAVRVIKRAKKFQIIVNSMLEALPAMSSLGLLLFLFMFLFSIIGI